MYDEEKIEHSAAIIGRLISTLIILSEELSSRTSLTWLIATKAKFAATKIADSGSKNCCGSGLLFAADITELPPEN